METGRLSQPPRILGIDPGLRVSGYAVIEDRRDGPGPRIVEAGVIRVPTDLPLTGRLHHLHAETLELIREHRPSMMAVEELFSHYERPKTAILMGHARGVLLLAAAECGLSVASYLPTRVKKMTTGSGSANKAQMQRAIQVQFQLSAAPEPADVADALAVALCHLHASRRAG